MTKLLKFSIFSIICLYLLVSTTGCNLLGKDDDNDVIMTAPAPVLVLSRWIVKAGQEQAARAAAIEFVQETRKETGVLSYDLYAEVLLDGAVPVAQTFWFREVFTDFAAIGAHMSAPHFATFMASATATFNSPLGAADDSGVATTTPTFFDVTLQPQTTYAAALKNPGLIKIAYLKAPAGKADSANSLLETLMTTTRAEAGCYGFDYYQGFNDPTDGVVGTPQEVFQVFQQWQNEDAYVAHTKASGYTTYNTGLTGLVVTEAVSTISRVGAPYNSLRFNAMAADAQPKFVSQSVNAKIMSDYVKAMNGQ